MRKPFDYNKMQNKVYKQTPVKLPKLPTPSDPARGFSTSPEYYYVIAKQDGRIVVLGAYNTEADAYEMAYKLNVPYVVTPLRTNDIARATAMVKHQLLSKSGDLAASLRRMKHSV